MKLRRIAFSMFFFGTGLIAGTPAPTITKPVSATLTWAVLTSVDGKDMFEAQTVDVLAFAYAPDPSKYLVTVSNVTGDALPDSKIQKPSIKGTYLVSKDDFSSSNQSLTNPSSTSNDLIVGILSVPFKYHPSDYSTTAGSTIGGYLGWTAPWIPTNKVKIIVSGGLALVDPTAATVPAGSGSSTTSTTQQTSPGTLTGVSVAGGFVGNVLGGAQFGVVFGTDLIDKSKEYKYNGKLWISFMVGYNFMTPSN